MRLKFYLKVLKSDWMMRSHLRVVTQLLTDFLLFNLLLVGIGQFLIVNLGPSPKIPYSIVHDHFNCSKVQLQGPFSPVSDLFINN